MYYRRIDYVDLPIVLLSFHPSPCTQTNLPHSNGMWGQREVGVCACAPHASPLLGLGLAPELTLAPARLSVGGWMRYATRHAPRKTLLMKRLTNDGPDHSVRRWSSHHSTRLLRKLVAHG